MTLCISLIGLVKKRLGKKGEENRRRKIRQKGEKAQPIKGLGGTHLLLPCLS